KVLALFPHFKQGKKTDEAITAVFNQSVDEFDNAFQAYLHERFQPQRAKVLWPDSKSISVSGNNQSQELAELRRRAESDPQDFFANLLYGVRLAKNGQNAEAEIYLKKAKALFPEYVDVNNAYELLAEIYWQQTRRAEAVAELEYLTAKNAKAYQAAARLAEWQLAMGDTVAANRATERALAIFPYNLALQRQHGQLLLALRQPQGAVQAFRTVLALKPVDQADAYCWLAQAYLRGGQKQQAKKHALLALEIAPTFERAQEILLQAVE
ncbi:MAG: tetratricopeptide repeat protein, partial [candidate division KSB1 bacterium]|nr:tetratricopeptide repeat protein [candidate division KSB1 bacterium]